jgi:nucleoside-diphosphate kinase
MERTLVILKPDALQRGLIGEIVARFERTGLRIAGLKMIKPTVDLANKHYPKDRDEFIIGMGNKSLTNYNELGVDPLKFHKSIDAKEIGLEVQGWLVDALTAGPVIVMVFEGPHAVELVRKITGPTLPIKAAPGTIRGDFSFDSSALANQDSRPIRNLIHASGDLAEAKHEIKLWFSDDDLYDYETIHQKHMTAK